MCIEEVARRREDEHRTEPVRSDHLNGALRARGVRRAPST
jgi:hypothetical protein